MTINFEASGSQLTLGLGQQAARELGEREMGGGGRARGCSRTVRGGWKVVVKEN